MNKRNEYFPLCLRLQNHYKFYFMNIRTSPLFSVESDRSFTCLNILMQSLLPNKEILNQVVKRGHGVGALMFQLKYINTYFYR